MKYMKYLKYCVLLAMLLIAASIAGCGGKDETIQPVASGEPAVQTSGTSGGQQAAATAPISTELSAAEKALAEEKMKTGERVAVSTSMKIMTIGESYVFAAAITNIYPQAKKFRLRATIDDAKSPGLSNLIHTDETIDNWIAKSDFSVFELANGEVNVVPVVVVVGPEVAKGEPTVPGSYTFDVVFEIESSKGFWEKYNRGQDPLVIKIK